MTTTEVLRPATLSDKQWSLLAQLERYCTLTLDLLERLCSADSRDALRMAAERLRKQSWLCKTVLAGGEPCYALGPRAQRLLGMHFRPGFPFSQDGLLQHMAIGTFCALARFHRLLPHEIRERFPETHRPGLPGRNYCLDTEDERTLAWIIVDHGNEAGRFPGKVFHVISARLELPGFERLIRAEQFQIVVITATPEKKARIQTAIQERSPASVPVSVVSIPSLLQFLL